MMLRMMEAQGLDVARVMDEVGIAESVLRQPNARLPSRLSDVFFRRAMEAIPIRPSACAPPNTGTPPTWAPSATPGCRAPPCARGFCAWSAMRGYSAIASATPA
jgi:hypothetical protein